MWEISPGLFLGTREDAAAHGRNVQPGWTVISVTEYRAHYGRTEELPNEPTDAQDLAFMRLGTADVGMLDAISDVIERDIAAGKRVLVHCVHAHERSPLAIAWHLARVGEVPAIEAAYARLMAIRPAVQLRTKWLYGARPTRSSP